MARDKLSERPGRKRGELRGEYVEVCALASALRDIADTHGLALREIERRMPYARTTISKNLSGEDRPAWEFVVAFLGACTGGDRQAMAVLERRVRVLWDAAAPGRACRLATATTEQQALIPGDVGAWVTAMRETAAAQQAVARLQLSVSRNLGLVEGLTFMVAKLSSAAQSLTEERDGLRRELEGSSDSAGELLRTRSLLEDTQCRLQAAEQLLAQTNRRLDRALRQREWADRLKDAAIRQATAARSRLAAIEQHAVQFAEQIKEGAQVESGDAALIGALDQSVAEQILSRVDDTLGEEASNLDQLQGQLASTADNGTMSAGQRRVLPRDDGLQGLEEAAQLIRVYEVQFVPGLLQTEEYARSVIEQGTPGLHPDEVERRVALQMGRQQLLAKENPPRLWAIVDEAALRRPMGGRDVHVAQIERLIDLDWESHITLQVMPFRYGGHAANGGAFTIMRFPQAHLPDVVYLEYLTGAHFIDKPEEVDHYAAVMERLSVAGTSPNRTRDILAALRKEI
jgi:hypothetical protein